MANRKITVTNAAPGIRGFNAVQGLIELAPGQTVEGVEVPEGEVPVMERTGWFTLNSGGGGHGDPDKPQQRAAGDDLDTTVAELRAIAEREGVDLSGLTAKADIQAAIRAHRAGDSGDELDGMDEDTLRTTVSAITGKSEADVADLDRAALLRLARGEG